MINEIFDMEKKSKNDVYKNQTSFVKALMQNNLLTIRAGENVVRILPPLNVKKKKLIKI